MTNELDLSTFILCDALEARLPGEISLPPTVNIYNYAEWKAQQAKGECSKKKKKKQVSNDQKEELIIKNNVITVNNKKQEKHKEIFKTKSRSNSKNLTYKIEDESENANSTREESEIAAKMNECSQEKNKKRKNGAQTGEFLPKSKIPTRCNKESKKGESSKQKKKEQESKEQKDEVIHENYITTKSKNNCKNFTYKNGGESENANSAQEKCEITPKISEYSQPKNKKRRKTEQTEEFPTKNNIPIKSNEDTKKDGGPKQKKNKRDSREQKQEKKGKAENNKNLSYENGDASENEIGAHKENEIPPKKSKYSRKMNKKREEETEVVIYKSNIATVSNEQVSEFKKGKYSQRKNKKRKSGGSTEESVANDVAAISNDKQDLEPIRTPSSKIRRRTLYSPHAFEMSADCTKLFSDVIKENKL